MARDKRDLLNENPVSKSDLCFMTQVMKVQIF